MSNIGSYNPNQPRRGNYGPRLKRFSLKKDSEFVAAVLPPFKSLKDNNAIAQYWSIIWLTDSRSKKRPVPSIERKKNKVIVQPDPILEKAAAMKAIIANAEASGENPQVIQQMKEKVSSLDPDKKYHMNVITPSGEIGVLAISYTCYQALEAKLKDLSKTGISAIGPSSLFLVFKRWKDAQGKTMYGVDVSTKHVRNPQTGGISVEYNTITIDENIVARMENEAADLSKLFEYRSLEEQAQLASLDPNVISRVLQKGRPAEEEAEKEDEPEDTPTSGYSVPTTTTSAAPAALSTVNGAVPAQVLPTQITQQAPAPIAPAAIAPAPAAPAPAPAQTMSAQLGAQFGGNIPDDVKKFLAFNGGGQSR